MLSDKKIDLDFRQEQDNIGKGTTLRGNIESEGNFRMDGRLFGNLNIGGKLIIGKSGYIEGEVICANADVEGSFEGKFKVNQCLNLKSTAQISGAVITAQLVMEAGATLNASCQMGGEVPSPGSWDTLKKKWQTIKKKGVKNNLVAG
jgi:cytoskeletal protein CcmA (bactofilin family)